MPEVTNQNNAANVSTGKPKITGAIFTAPEGTPLPTDEKTALNAAFVCLGYASEDGVTNGITRDSDKVKAWGGDTVLTPQTEYEETFGFKLIEAVRKEVLQVVYGESNVTEDSTNKLRTTKANSAELEKRSWIFDMVMSGRKARRIVVPSAKVTEIGDVVYVDNDPVSYELTVTATPDSSSNTSYIYDAL